MVLPLIEEGLNKTYLNSKGAIKKCGKQDLNYDIKHGYINIQSATSDETLEQVNLQQEVVMEVINSILKRDNEVTIEVNTPDGDFEVWLDWATIQFRFFRPASRYTGSFCVFGPVLSSPAHGVISLAME
jgi:hypothetical protein